MKNSEITNEYIEGLRLEMHAKILELETNKESPDRIAKVKTAYKKAISENISKEAKIREYMDGFLIAIDKFGCTETEYRIRQFFFGIPKWRKTLKIPIGPFYARKGMVSAYAKHIRADSDQKKESGVKKNKLQKLLKAQTEVLQLCSDIGIQLFYDEIAENNHEVKSSVIQEHRNDFLKKLSASTFELDLLLNHSEALPSGLNSLEEYVYKIAQLYEEITTDHFDFMRHKTEHGVHAGEYAPITKAHSFVVKAIEWMQAEFSDNGIAYTSTNICTACENVRTRLNKERRQ